MARWIWMGTWVAALCGCAKVAVPQAASDAGMDAHAPVDASGDASQADAQAAEGGLDGSEVADAAPPDGAAPCVTDPACGDDGNECVCRPRLADGGCGSVNLPTCTPCEGGWSYCGGGTCLTFNCMDLDDDCNVGVCNPGPGEWCLLEPRADCTPCSDGAGVCSGGECVTDTCPAACDPQDCPEP
jgi:hypothetical protein